MWRLRAWVSVGILMRSKCLSREWHNILEHIKWEKLFHIFRLPLPTRWMLGLVCVCVCRVLLMFRLIMRRNDIIYLIYLCSINTRYASPDKQFETRAHVRFRFAMQKLFGACSAITADQTCSTDKNRFDERRHTKWQLFVVFNSLSSWFLSRQRQSHQR